MKTIPMLVTSLALLFVSAPSGAAQPFQSGSNGSLGPLNVTTTDVTLDLPPDGIFHYTTINVTRNLRFRRNALNTPVYLLATGDVIISGSIDVSATRGTATTPGFGGPGGFDGGAPGATGLPGGDGLGPGAGKGGTSTGAPTDAGPASYANVSSTGPAAQRGLVYGSPLLLPIVGGSGGGGASGNPGWGGGGGGGGIVIASSTKITHTGTIRAFGGQALSATVQNTGSGGAIRLVAPIIAGAGSIDVRGDGGNSGKGDGRIRVDALDRTGLNFGFSPNTTASVGGLMVVFPDPLPRLDIIEAAGRVIPVDSGPSQVLLPAGSSPNQTVKVRARDFGQSVPIRVVLTPDNGPSQAYEAQIDNAAANPAEASVNVTFPVNVLTHVHVWTR
ncbi:MAG: hypothetical protein L0Z50_14160 [Verrucomicrobiales bacterium]|nr:hypothetical protein [Verrucomicrobiales bacterium]